MKILSLPVDKGGCGFYRIRQPLTMVKNHTEHDTYILGEKDDGIEAAIALHYADVVVVRPGVPLVPTKDRFNTLVGELGSELKKDFSIHAKWVMDIDDNAELISPYSDHYKEHGIEEYFDTNSNVWLWKDGENGFDLQKNRRKIADHIQSLRDADLVTVTTDKLAEYASQYNKNVVVLPNAVDFSRWWKLDLKPNKQLRVGWSGGHSHYEDWTTIREPLNNLMREYQFKLVSAGHSFPGLIDEDNQHLFESHDWVPFKGHPYRMMCMALDIAIIPLADLPFNHYKSPIKYVEMSAMGIPSVVANVTPYKEILSESRASAYNTPQQFYNSLKQLLTAPRLRKELGAAARKYVEDNFDAKKSADKWVEAYERIV